MTEKAIPDIETQREHYDGIWKNLAESGYKRQQHFKNRVYVVTRLLEGLAMARPQILEVGCGFGTLSNELSKYGSVTAMDLSPKAVELGRKLYPQVSFFAGDVMNYKFGQELFDIVVCSEVIEHLPVDQRKAFVKILAERLRPGGHLILTTPNKVLSDRLSTFQLIEEHFFESELRALLGAHFNFKVFSTVHRVFPVRGHRLKIFQALRVIAYEVFRLRTVVENPYRESHKGLYFVVLGQRKLQPGEEKKRLKNAGKNSQVTEWISEREIRMAIGSNAVMREARVLRKDVSSVKNEEVRAPSICILIETFYPVMHGGTAHLMRLAGHLKKHRSHVMMVTRQIKPEDARRELVGGIEVLRVKPVVGLRPIGKYLMMIPALIELILKRQEFDFIIVCDFKALGVVGVAASKLLGKKCYLRAESCGEMDGTYATRLWKSKFAKGAMNVVFSIRNAVLRQADGFISISKAIKSEFISSGVGARRIIDITNGIDTKLFSPLPEGEKRAMRVRLGIPIGPSFLFTGRLAKGKGLEYLLKVWRSVQSSFSNAHLFLAGSGQGFSMSCEEELRSYVAENSLGASVTFTGNVGNIHEYLQAVDFFLLPSASEGMPLSLVEAMCCGVPSIGTDVRGIREIIEHGVNGFLVKYGDEAELFEMMKKMISNRERAVALGMAGRISVSEKFNIANLAKRYLELPHEKA